MTLAKENRAPLVLGGANALAYAPSFAYTNNVGSASISAFSVNASTGSLTPLNNNIPYPVGSSALGISVVPGTEVVVSDPSAANIDWFLQNADGTLGLEHSIGSQGLLVTGLPEPAGSVVDPSGRFLYVVDALANGIEAYSTVPFVPLLATPFTPMGDPVALSAYLAGTIPTVTVIDPSGTYLLCVNQLTATINLFRVDSSFGALLDDTQFPFSGTPTGIAIDPAGYVVVSDGLGNAYTYILDPINLTLVGPTITPIPGGQINSVAINPVNHAAYFPFSSVGNSGPGGVAGYVISKTNGVPNLTPIPGSPFSADRSPTSLSIAGSFAYVTNFDSNDVSLFTADADSETLKFSGKVSSHFDLGPAQVPVTGSFKEENIIEKTDNLMAFSIAQFGTADCTSFQMTFQFQCNEI